MLFSQREIQALGLHRRPQLPCIAALTIANLPDSQRWSPEKKTVAIAIVSGDRRLPRSAEEVMALAGSHALLPGERWSPETYQQVLAVAEEVSIDTGRQWSRHQALAHLIGYSEWPAVDLPELV